MNKKELNESIVGSIHSINHLGLTNKTLQDVSMDILLAVDKYVESTIDPFQVKQLDENIINITDLLVIGEGFAKTFARAKQIATMFNVTSKYMFGDFEVLVRENSKFDDVKGLYLEFLYDNNNQF